MPALNQSAQIELSSPAACANGRHVSVDIIEDPREPLRAQIDRLPLTPENRQLATEALDDLRLSTQGAVADWAFSFHEERSFAALVTLHQLKVIDLNNIQSLVHARAPLNAIEFLCDYLPPPNIRGDGDPADWIARLAHCGVSANGARRSNDPPLAHALRQEQNPSTSIVSALLAAGADPLLKTSEGASCVALAGRLNKPEELGLMLDHLHHQGRLSGQVLDKLLTSAICTDCVLIFDHLRSSNEITQEPAILARVLVKNGQHLGPRLQRRLLEEGEELAPQWDTRLEAMKLLAKRDDKEALGATRAMLSRAVAEGGVLAPRAQQLFDTLVSESVERRAANSLKGLLAAPLESGAPHALRLTDPHLLLIDLNRSWCANGKKLGRLVCCYLKHTPARNGEGDVVSGFQVLDSLRQAYPRRSRDSVAAALVVLTLLVGLGLYVLGSIARSRSQHAGEQLGVFYDNNLAELDKCWIPPPSSGGYTRRRLASDDHYRACMRRDHEMEFFVRYFGNSDFGYRGYRGLDDLVSAWEACDGVSSKSSDCLRFGADVVELARTHLSGKKLARYTWIPGNVMWGLALLFSPVVLVEAQRLRRADFVRSMESELLQPPPQGQRAGASHVAGI